MGHKSPPRSPGLASFLVSVRGLSEICRSYAKPNRYAQLALGLDETQAAADKLGVGGDGRLANGPRRTCAACVTLRMDSIHFPRQRDVPPRCHKHERKSTPETGRRSRGRRVWDLPLSPPGMTTLICAVVPDWLTERCLSSSVRLQVS